MHKHKHKHKTSTSTNDTYLTGSQSLSDIGLLLDQLRSLLEEWHDVIAALGRRVQIVQIALQLGVCLGTQ